MNNPKNTTTQEINEKGRLPLDLPNFDRFDFDDCASILKRLETLDRKGADRKYLEICIARLESQVNYAMLF